MENIEEEEEIIQYLEMIDDRFSMIKTVCREIKNKVKNLGTTNKKMVENCQSWINFFSSENSQKKNSLKSQTMENTEPNNPFEDQSWDHTLKDRIDPLNPSSSTTINLSKLNFSQFDTTVNSTVENLTLKDLPDDLSKRICFEDTSSSLIQPQENSETPFVNDESFTKEFIFSEIPEIFQKEEILPKLYEFIKNSKNVTYNEIYKKFDDASKEKIDILINFLVRRFIVKKRNGVLSVDK